jgi:prolipoprotein diacylglyceryl transferase
LICAVLLWVDRRFRMDRGRLFALYVVGYTLGRFWIELMRSDAATLILGLRVNTIVSAVVLLAGVAYLVITRRRGENDTGVTGDTSTV